MFGLLGPNGAGKSTTIGMLTTTIVPTSGTARLAGFDVARDPIAARSVASVVFQEAVVDASLMHEGRIAGLDTPDRLLSALGEEILELRVDGDGVAVLAALRARGLANRHAFAIGSTLTVPLHDEPAEEAIASLRAIDQTTSGITTRAPTLDDVYLRLTGDRLPDAA